jgi:hypothetical protein
MNFELINSTALSGAKLPDFGVSGSKTGDDYSQPSGPILVSQTPQSLKRVVQRPSKSVEEQLFDAVAEAKVWTSRVAMRLDPLARVRLFEQLDRLHDANEWFGGDKPIAVESYKTFVRALLLLGIARRPALALTPAGNLMGMWGSERSGVTVEFLPSDRLRLLVTDKDRGESAALNAPASRLLEVLAPYEPHRWLSAT